MKNIIVPAALVAGILTFTWFSGSPATAYIVAAVAVVAGCAYAIFSRRQAKKIVLAAAEAAKPEYERVLARAKIEKLPRAIGRKGAVEWMAIAFDFRDKGEIEFAIAAFEKAAALAEEDAGPTHLYAFSARKQASELRARLNPVDGPSRRSS